MKDKTIIHVIKGDLYGGSDVLSKRLFKRIEKGNSQKIIYFEKEGKLQYKQFEGNKVSIIKIKNEIIFANLYSSILKFLNSDIIHLHHIKVWVFFFPLIFFRKKIISSFHINFGVGIKKGLFENILITLIVSYSSIF